MQISSRRIKPIFWASLLSLAIIILPQVSHALTVKEVPNSRQVNGGWVTDMANIISNNTEAELNRIITELEAKNGTEIAVVTVPETAPSPTPKAFTTELFNYWGIGKKGVDNGVLFLVSLGDRRVEIETGYGVEGVLPDARVGNIIETKITPRFKQQDFDGGILAGTKSLVAVLGEEIGGEISKTKKNAEFRKVPGWLLGVIPGGIVLSIAGFITAFKKHNKKTTEVQSYPSYSTITVSTYWIIYSSSLILIFTISFLLIVLTTILNPLFFLIIPLVVFLFCAWKLAKTKDFFSIFGVLLLGIVLSVISSIFLFVTLPEALSFALLFSLILISFSILAALLTTNILSEKLEGKKGLTYGNYGAKMMGSESIYRNDYYGSDRTGGNNGSGSSYGSGSNVSGSGGGSYGGGSSVGSDSYGGGSSGGGGAGGSW